MSGEVSSARSTQCQIVCSIKNMPKALVAMNAQGRVTLPADIRKRLRLAEGDRLEVSLDEDRITLRPARVVAAEDAWAYTAENLRGIRRALDDIAAGRTYRLSWEELERTGRTRKLPSPPAQPAKGKSA